MDTVVCDEAAVQYCEAHRVPEAHGSMQILEILFYWD